MTGSHERVGGTPQRRRGERRKNIYSATRYVGMQRRLDDRRRSVRRSQLQREKQLVRDTDRVPLD